jgi:hypothetical protein
MGSYNCSADNSRSLADILSCKPKIKTKEEDQIGPPGITDALFNVDSNGGAGETSLAYAII